MGPGEEGSGAFSEFFFLHYQKFFKFVFEPPNYHGKVERFLLSMLRYFFLFARINVMHEIISNFQKYL